MTLAGTRPPLISETNLYELHHRARLAIKPGITGMWQVSGRSDITDFEEVVRLDKEYITNWNIGLDIKILPECFKPKKKTMKFEACFDYILIDESQDFSEGFFKLCEKVTRKCVYVAGDIFQDIFKDNPSMVVNPDFLLNKCYRTDAKHCKYSVSDGRYKIYNHKLYKLLLTDPPESMRDNIFEIDGTKYLWMLFEELEVDLNTMQKNDDVIAFVKSKI